MNHMNAKAGRALRKTLNAIIVAIAAIDLQPRPNAIQIVMVPLLRSGRELTNRIARGLGVLVEYSAAQLRVQLFSPVIVHGKPLGV
jgi:hypothetical protein